MFDKELVLGSLENIFTATQTIIQRASEVEALDDLPKTPGGVLRLDALCMNLIALGEAVKGLDKLTHGQLLSQYPDIYWSGVMRMRDKIAHHYFEIDTDIVFRTIEEDIPKLYDTVKRMLNDIKQSNT